MNYPSGWFKECHKNISTATPKKMPKSVPPGWQFDEFIHIFSYISSFLTFLHLWLGVAMSICSTSVANFNQSTMAMFNHLVVTTNHLKFKQLPTTIKPLLNHDWPLLTTNIPFQHQRHWNPARLLDAIAQHLAVFLAASSPWIWTPGSKYMMLVKKKLYMQ